MPILLADSTMEDVPLTKQIPNGIILHGRDIDTHLTEVEGQTGTNMGGRIDITHHPTEKMMVTIGIETL